MRGVIRVLSCRFYGVEAQLDAQIPGRCTVDICRTPHHKFSAFGDGLKCLARVGNDGSTSPV